MSPIRGVALAVSTLLAGALVALPSGASSAAYTRESGDRVVAAKTTGFSGKIKSAKPLSSYLGIDLFKKTAAKDNTEGYVLVDPNDFAFSLNPKTGAYSAIAAPGTYRIGFYGSYKSGKPWGDIPYGPKSSPGAIFGTSFTVRKGKATTGISITADGTFAPLPAATGPEIHGTVCGGCTVSVSGSFPGAKKLSYEWDALTNKGVSVLGFGTSVKIPASDSGTTNSLEVDVYEFTRGKLMGSPGVSETPIS
jgi:hypothetical protein